MQIDRHGIAFARTLSEDLEHHTLVGAQSVRLALAAEKRRVAYARAAASTAGLALVLALGLHGGWLLLVSQPLGVFVWCAAKRRVAEIEAAAHRRDQARAEGAHAATYASMRGFAGALTAPARPSVIVQVGTALGQGKEAAS